MCTEGREYLYLERPLRRSLLYLVLFQKASKITINFVSISFQFFNADVTSLAILRGLQGIGCAAMPPAGASHLLFNIRSHILIFL